MASEPEVVSEVFEAGAFFHAAGTVNSVISALDRGLNLNDVQPADNVSNLGSS